MSTHFPQSSGGSIYFPCSPDQFAVFKRGDRVVRTAVSVPSSFEWIESGEPPQKDKVYVVRDYHYGYAETNGGRPPVYGQILNLVECVCHRTPQGLEYGWFHAGFRKVTEEEIAARVAQTQEVSL
jgi:hypothetical protein